MAGRCRAQTHPKVAVGEARAAGMLVLPQEGYKKMVKHCGLHTPINKAMARRHQLYACAKETKQEAHAAAT